MNTDTLVLCIIHGERLFGEYLKRVLLSLPEDAFTETVIEDILRTKPDFSNVIPQNRLTPWTASLMAKTIHVNALEYIPPSMIDEKLLREALSEVNDAIPLFSRRNEKNFAVIPDRLWSKALVKTMVEKIPDNHAVRLLKDLCSIPAAKKNLLDENLFLTLVRKDPDCIKYVPEECLTESLYVAAIAKSPEIIKTVNFKRRTEAMLLAAIGRPSDRMNGLTYITDSQKTPEFLEKALRQNPNIWSSIPEKIRTPEFAEKIALAFMENNAEQLYNFLMDAKKTLPNSFWSRKDILQQLVAIDCYNIFCIPEQFRTPELRIQAAVVGVRQRLSFLRLLTDDIPLSTDVMKQIEKGTLARIAELEEQHRTLDNQDLMNIPKRFLTHRVCMGLVTVNEHINFAVLPEKNLDADVYATYVATWNRIDTFNRIPLQGKDFWEKAVKMNPRVAAFAPFSPELFRGAIKEDGEVFGIVLEKIPQKYMREFAELAVQSGKFSPNAIQDAGQEDLLTENNLLKNIRSPFDLDVIPDKFITVPLVLRAIATVAKDYERTDVIQTALPERFHGNMQILRAMAEKDVPIPASWIYDIPVNRIDDAVMEYVIKHGYHDVPVSPETYLHIFGYDLSYIDGLDDASRLKVIEQVTEKADDERMEIAQCIWEEFQRLLFTGDSRFEEAFSVNSSIAMRSMARDPKILDACAKGWNMLDEESRQSMSWDADYIPAFVAACINPATGLVEDWEERFLAEQKKENSPSMH